MGLRPTARAGRCRSTTTRMRVQPGGDGQPARLIRSPPTSSSAEGTHRRHRPHQPSRRSGWRKKMRRRAASAASSASAAPSAPTSGHRFNKRIAHPTYMPAPRCMSLCCGAASASAAKSAAAPPRRASSPSTATSQPLGVLSREINKRSNNLGWRSRCQRAWVRLKRQAGQLAEGSAGGQPVPGDAGHARRARTRWSTAPGCLTPTASPRCRS